MSAFIWDDGYTLDGYIAAVPRLHPEVRFTFRPVLYAGRQAWARQMNKTSDADGDTKCSVELICKHVKSWELKHNDAEVEIKPDTVARLHPQILHKMLDIVLGYAPSEELKDVKN